MTAGDHAGGGGDLGGYLFGEGHDALERDVN